MKVLFLMDNNDGYHYMLEPMKYSGLLNDYKVFNYGIYFFNAKEAQINNAIMQIKNTIGNSPTIIYGAGDFFQSNLDSFNQLNIVAVSDKDKSLHYKKIANFPVIPPEEIDANSHKIVIASANSQEEIYKELKEKNHFYDIYRVFDDYNDPYDLANSKLKIDVENLINEYQPNLIMYSSSLPYENIKKDTFLNIKKQYQNMKIFVQWWDFCDKEKNGFKWGIGKVKKYTFTQWEQDSLIFADYIQISFTYSQFLAVHNRFGKYKNLKNSSNVFWNPISVNPYICKNLGLSKTIDIATFGALVDRRVELYNNLNEEYKEKYQHFGAGSKYNNRRVSYEDYVEYLNKTKIMINSQVGEYRIQVKGKVSEALACGTFLLEEDNLETRAFVPEGTGVIYFIGFEDLKNKINYYLEHEEEREHIAKKGYKWYHKNYSAQKWATRVFNELDLL